MSKRAKEAALKAYPVKDYNKEPNYMHYCDTNTLDKVYREVFKLGYMQAEKDLAKAILAEYKKQWDLCPDADKDDDYTISETQQLGRFMMMEDLYEKFCEPVGVTLDDLEDEK